MLINSFNHVIDNYEINIYTIKLNPVPIFEIDDNYNMLTKKTPTRYETGLMFSFNGDESWNIEQLFISVDENIDKANDNFNKLKSRFETSTIEDILSNIEDMSLMF